MKFTLLFLMCFASCSWQHNAFWSFTPGSYPLLYPNSMDDYKEFQDAGSMISFPESRRNYYPNTPKIYSNRFKQQMRLYEDQHSRFNNLFNMGGNVYQRNNAFEDLSDSGNPQLRWFAGLNFASSLFSSLATSITYATSTSTVPATSIVTCYLSTLFNATSACRRKRTSIFPNVLIDDIGNSYFVPPDSKLPNSSNIATANTLEFLPREGRDIDVGLLLSSSQDQDAAEYLLFRQAKQTESAVKRYIKQNRLLINKYIVTSTVTAYMLSA